MPCTRPLKAYWGPGRTVVWDSKAGYSDRPLELRCGQCIKCRIAKSREWALRVMHELSDHQVASFVTLTYDDEHLPPDGGLQMSDWQLFMKRLRKASTQKLRFFMAGEYGDETLRPHYHVVLFGEDFRSDRVHHSRRGGNDLFTSPRLEQLWGLGFAPFGNVTFQSAAYVARYCIKKRTGPEAEEHYTRYDSNTGECWNVRPEFINMSRNPGIGARWLDRYTTDVYPDDQVVHAGRKFRPPSYYDKRMEALNPELMEEIKKKRRQRFTTETDPQRLRSIEKCEVARQALHTYRGM